MDDFHSLLESCAAEHGHLCPGQVVGVRMAILGCRLIGMDQPTRIDQMPLPMSPALNLGDGVSSLSIMALWPQPS